MINEILSKLQKVKKLKDNQWQARCPRHGDDNPSLTITNDSGKILIHCHAGCSFNEIVAALGMEIKDFFPEQREKPEIQEVYVYQDKAGKPLFEVVRFFPKDFRQRRPDGEWGLGGIKPVLYHLPLVKKAITDGETIFIVEGEKDCDNLRQLGLVATTSPMGAGKWRSYYSNSLQGADVVIIPDNDQPGEEHAEAVARSLKGKAKSIKILRLPDLKEKGDVTDWLSTGGTKEELLKLAADTEEWKPAAKQTLAGDVGRFFDEKMFIPKRLADEIEQRWPFKRIYGELRYFNNGVYVTGGEDFFKKKALTLLGEDYRPGRVDSAFRYIWDSRLDEEPRLNPAIINVKNGRLCWPQNELLDHNHQLPGILQLPIDYDPEADCPEFKKYLKTTFDPEVIPLVLELLGYLLIPSTRFQVAFMLVGSGKNGKSVLIRVIENLLGRENVANIELQRFSETRFAAAGLAGKLVNTFADLSSRAIKDSSLFKTLVAGDTITGERKYGQPFEFRNFARMVFSANEIPRSTDKTYAYYRRWIIIPFDRCFEGESEDRGLEDKLKNELSGIFNLALEGLKRLTENGAFTEPSAVKEALESYKIQNDSILAFLKECCKVDEKKKVSKQGLYDSYKEFCEDQGMRPVSQRKLRDQMLRTFPTIKEGRDGAYGPRIWKGIGILTESGTPDLHSIAL